MSNGGDFSLGPSWLVGWFESSHIGIGIGAPALSFP
jgi:hypothetical protein